MKTNVTAQRGIKFRDLDPDVYFVFKTNPKKLFVKGRGYTYHECGENMYGIGHNIKTTSNPEVLIAAIKYIEVVLYRTPYELI